MSDFEYSNFFPYSEIREQQKNAIDFAIDAFVKQNKRFVVIEAGTGVGKSAIGLTLARYLNKHALFSDDYTPGSYFLTTQKILQDQYLRDFGKPSGCMLSLMDFHCPKEFNRNIQEIQKEMKHHRGHIKELQRQYEGK